jgi:uncharacterized protein YjbI with pentapeptide repeats
LAGITNAGSSSSGIISNLLLGAAVLSKAMCNFPYVVLAGMDMEGAMLGPAPPCVLLLTVLEEMDLDEMDLAEMDLAGIDLAGTDVAVMDLAGVDLPEMDSAGIDLAEMDFPVMDLPEIDLAEMVLPEGPSATTADLP